MKKTASRLVKKSATNIARKVLGAEDPTKKIECLKHCLNCLERKREILSQQNDQLQTHKCPNCNFSHQTLVEVGPKDPNEAFALNLINKVASNDIMCYSDGNASIIYLPSNGSGLPKPTKRTLTLEDDCERDIDITETEISAKDRKTQGRDKYSPGESPRVSPEKRGLDQRTTKRTWVERLSVSPRASPETSVGRSSADRRGAVRGETRLREGSMKSRLSDTKQNLHSEDERHAVRGSATRTIFKDSPRRTPDLDDKRLPTNTARSEVERYSKERHLDNQSINPTYIEGQEIFQDMQETRGEWHRSMLKETLPTLEELPNDDMDIRSDKVFVDHHDSPRQHSIELQNFSDRNKSRSRRASAERRGDQQYRPEFQNEDPRRSPSLENPKGTSPPGTIFIDSAGGRGRQSSMSQTKDHQQDHQQNHPDASLMHNNDNGSKDPYSDDSRMNVRHDRHIIQDDFRVRDEQSMLKLTKSGSLKENLRSDAARQKGPDLNIPRAPGAGSVAANRFDAGQSGSLKGSLKRPVMSKGSVTVRNSSDKTKSIHGGIHRKNNSILQNHPSKEQSMSQHTLKDYFGARRSPLTHHDQLLASKKHSRHVFVQPTHIKDASMHRCNSLTNCCGNVTVCVCCAKQDGIQQGSSSCCCNASVCCADNHAANSEISHENKDNFPRTPSNHCCQIAIVHHPSGTCLTECAACKDPHFFERNDFHTHEAQSSTMCNYHNLLCEQQKLSLAETGHHLHFLDGNHHDQVNPTAHKIREAISLPRFDFENNRIICDPRNPAIHSRLSGHRFEPSKYSMYPVDPHILNLLYKNKEKYRNKETHQMPELFKDGVSIDPLPGTSTSGNSLKTSPTLNHDSNRETVFARASEPRYDSTHNRMNNAPKDNSFSPVKNPSQYATPGLRSLSPYDPKNSLIPESRQLHAAELRNNLASDSSVGPNPDQRSVSASDSRSFPEPDYEPEKNKGRFKLPKFLRRSDRKSVSTDYGNRRSQTPERGELRGNPEIVAPSAVTGIETEGPMPGNGVSRTSTQNHPEQSPGTFEQRPHQTDLYEVLRRSTNCSDANWWGKASQKSIGSRHKPPGHPNSIQEHQNFYHPNAFDQTDSDSDGPSLCGYDMFLLRHPELQPPPSVDVDANRSIEERMAEARASFYKYLPPKYDENYLEMITGRKIREGSKRYTSEPRCIYPELHGGGYDPSSKKKFVCSCTSDKDFDCPTIDGVLSSQNMLMGSSYVNSASMGQTAADQTPMSQMHMNQEPMHQPNLGQINVGQTGQQSQPQPPPQQSEIANKKGFSGFFKPKEPSYSCTPLTTPGGQGFMQQPPIGIPSVNSTVHQNHSQLFGAQHFAQNMSMPQPLMPQQENCVPPACNPKTSKYSLNKKRVKSGSDYNIRDVQATASFLANTSLPQPSPYMLPDYSNSQFSTVPNFSQSQFSYPDYSHSNANPTLFGGTISSTPVYVDPQFRIVDPQEQARWAQEKQNWRGET